MIQQNASAAEEMASTAGELSSQAELLQGTIAFFKIDKVSVSLCSRQEFPVADALPEAPTEKTATMGKSDAAARSVVGQELLMMSDRDIDFPFDSVQSKPAFKPHLVT